MTKYGPGGPGRATVMTRRGRAGGASVATIVIGIGGGSGSGKSTIARRTVTAVPARRIALVEHDAYYRDLSRLPLDARGQRNFDHPDAYDTALLVEHLTGLRAGRSVEAPVYDFTTHTRWPQTRRIDPTDVVIVEGILTLADARLRALFDVKVYVETDADVRILRRLARDISERGRRLESVREQYLHTVRPMHLAHVEPSKQWADLVVPGEGDIDAAVGLLVDRLHTFIDAK